MDRCWRLIGVSVIALTLAGGTLYLELYSPNKYGEDYGSLGSVRTRDSYLHLNNSEANSGQNRSHNGKSSNPSFPGKDTTERGSQLNDSDSSSATPSKSRSKNTTARGNDGGATTATPPSWTDTPATGNAGAGVISNSKLEDETIELEIPTTTLIAGVYNPVCLHWSNFTLHKRKWLDVDIQLRVADLETTVSMRGGYGCVMVPVALEWGGKTAPLKAILPVRRTWHVAIQKRICSMEITESIIPPSKSIWKTDDVVCIHQSTLVPKDTELRIEPNVTVKFYNNVTMNIEGKLRSFAYLGGNVIFTSLTSSPSTPHIRLQNSFSILNGIWIMSPNGKAVMSAYSGGLFWANGGVIIHSSIHKYDAGPRPVAWLYFEHTRIRMLHEFGCWMSRFFYILSIASRTR